VCCMNTSAPPEERNCAFPQEWADNDEMLAWLAEQAELEAAARSIGAPIDGETWKGMREAAAELGDDVDDVPLGNLVGGMAAAAHAGLVSEGGGGSGGGNGDDGSGDGDGDGGDDNGDGGGGSGNDVGGGDGSQGDRRDSFQRIAALSKEEAGIQDFLPRGSVSGFAAEAMTAEDEEEHDDPGRVDGVPRAMPPPRQRGRAYAAVPVRCGGMPGVFLARRAMFRCMCEEDHENCRATSGEGDGNVLTSTAFEKHCGMERSKNWRNSVSVSCSGEPRPVKIGIWLGEVGIDVARGKGGGPGGHGGKTFGGGGGGGGDGGGSHKRKCKQGDQRWQPVKPGPLNALPLRNVMAALEVMIDHSDSLEEGRREVARATCVCKAWLCAGLTVLKSRGAEVEKWQPAGLPCPRPKLEPVAPGPELPKTEPVTEPEPEMEPRTGTGMEPEPGTGTGTEPEPGTGTGMEPEPEPGMEIEPKTEPESEQGEIAAPLPVGMDSEPVGMDSEPAGMDSEPAPTAAPAAAAVEAGGTATGDGTRDGRRDGEGGEEGSAPAAAAAAAADAAVPMATDENGDGGDNGGGAGKAAEETITEADAEAITAAAGRRDRKAPELYRPPPPGVGGSMKSDHKPAAASKDEVWLYTLQSVDPYEP
jgi:hypothetical protein